MCTEESAQDSEGRYLKCILRIVICETVILKKKKKSLETLGFKERKVDLAFHLTVVIELFLSPLTSKDI